MLYVKHSLPPAMRELLASLRGARPPTALVCEDFPDAAALRRLDDAGFSLFYGFGLPDKPVIFFGRRRAFVLEGDGSTVTPVDRPEDLYFRLLWRRFGHAVSLRGHVKETDSRRHLFCLRSEDGLEHWCRWDRAEPIRFPEAGASVGIFAWERWGSRVLLALEIRCEN